MFFGAGRGLAGEMRGGGERWRAPFVFPEALPQIKRRSRTSTTYDIMHESVLCSETNISFSLRATNPPDFSIYSEPSL